MYISSRSARNETENKKKEKTDDLFSVQTSHDPITWAGFAWQNNSSPLSNIKKSVAFLPSENKEATRDPTLAEIYELFAREPRTPEDHALLAFQQGESAVDSATKWFWSCREGEKERKDGEREREKETRYVTSEQTTPTVFKNRRPSFSVSLSFLSGRGGRCEFTSVNHYVSTTVLSPTDDFLPDHR